MGSPFREEFRGDDEAQHRVTLTRDFYMMVFDVTQDEYRALMGASPSKFEDCGECPVEMVSWFDAIAYANKKSVQDGLTKCYSGSNESIEWDQNCTGYRLPTEAEWEYAARGGYDDETFAGSNWVDAVGWHEGNSNGRPQPVGQKSPNGYGLYDMSGNVWNWVWDRYSESLSDSRDPTGPASGATRVRRGGSWFSKAEDLRTANRYSSPPKKAASNLGFRLVRNR